MKSVLKEGRQVYPQQGPCFFSIVLYCFSEKGFHPELRTHLELDSKNGIHCTTGSLGHGLPISYGYGHGKKKIGWTGQNLRYDQ